MTNVNKDDQNSTDSSGQAATSGAGLPLRGLAMILIAVAVLLGLWGLYAMTREDSGDLTAAEETESTSVEESDSAAPAPEADAEADAEEATSAEAPASPTEQDADPATSESADTPAANAPAEISTEPAQVHVLNNSTVSNLAADVAGTLDAQGYDVGEVGNLSDPILLENTVFFEAGNADAENRARALADRVGGVAREIDGSVPFEKNGANDLTLILVTQVAL
ncbi:LytR C-terminal domain-containing protein [Corynebacterium alimapuense]|uniref:LytR C-terminal domain-containing protein n=1 Tax=Corynebacterium alimapuense TaxID=1576874 RepID=UPI000F80ABD0|nr:LytR C-terminal domain-containing protein [Corynebacterium alimapuense]